MSGSHSLSGFKGKMTTTVEIWKPDGEFYATHVVMTEWEELPEITSQKWRQIRFSHLIDGVEVSSGIDHSMPDIKDRHNNYAGYYNFGGKADTLN